MFWRKRRYIVVMMVHLGYVANYSMRVNLSVAIVEMTKNRTVQYADGTSGYVRNRLEELIFLIHKQLMTCRNNISTGIPKNGA